MVISDYFWKLPSSLNNFLTASSLLSWSTASIPACGQLLGQPLLHRVPHLVPSQVVWPHSSCAVPRCPTRVWLPHCPCPPHPPCTTLVSPMPAWGTPSSRAPSPGSRPPGHQWHRATESAETTDQQINPQSKQRQWHQQNICLFLKQTEPEWPV